ncbi:hypothetical protein [Frondihabitans australicus]|uniref:Uncharacterized protein n=1 Tax=Frondihabitans australicus TaxID=386892 RepID=A0A495IH22_9MICO|nr:hypothetical protein [Frondihabitans australicus]RKR74621.1 hypothetical protein C8E83_1745 [Frondihabitans australicus]
MRAQDHDTPHGPMPLAHLVAREAWLTIVAPTWPRGYVRLLGLAGIVEGVFLLLVWTTVPIGAVAVPCFAAGGLVFVASFVPRRHRARPDR